MFTNPSKLDAVFDPLCDIPTFKWGTVNNPVNAGFFL
jgi:hypothetical protein